MKTLTKDLIVANASSLILFILKQADSYGYELVHKMREFTNGELKWQEASIYPVLKILESEGYIRSYWKMEPGDRARRYYSIKEDGLKKLEANRQEWVMAQDMFSKMWTPA